MLVRVIPGFLVGALRRPMIHQEVEEQPGMMTSGQADRANHEDQNDQQFHK
ncbi:hypothetical protein BH23CHL2_BH23CHL2_26060 [soil metagenome]